MTKTVAIRNHRIGPGNPTYIIAEMSANHLMDLGRARDIVRAAADAGADAIKLQTYTPDTITFDSDASYFQVNQGTIWDGTTLHKLYESAYTPWEWHTELMELASEVGLDCFSSPFDLTAVDFLERLDVPAYKIASFEITDIPLIRKVAGTGKPVIISTGIARLADIELAVGACHEMGNANVVLLKCTSAYPAPYDEMNLKVIPSLSETFDVPVGLSDHSLGNEVAIAGVALGACVVEKHLTLRRSDGGPDSAFSMEPEEFASMVEGIRHAEASLGKVTYELTEKQIKSREHSRSLFVVRDMKKGEAFNGENVRSIRPAFGLHTIYLNNVLGRVARKDIPAGTPLTWALVD